MCSRTKTPLNYKTYFEKYNSQLYTYTEKCCCNTASVIISQNYQFFLRSLMSFDTLPIWDVSCPLRESKNVSYESMFYLANIIVCQNLISELYGRLLGNSLYTYSIIYIQICIIFLLYNRKKRKLKVCVFEENGFVKMKWVQRFF